MNRKELIDALSTKTNSTKVDADKAIGALIDIITAALKWETTLP
jgi:DNA-binding protein HU-beta